jgi:hypothetical protein
VILSALKKSCDAGKGSLAKRSALITRHQEVQINTGWILGGKFSWGKVNTRDPSVTRFYIMQIQPNGTYKLVN